MQNQGVETCLFNTPLDVEQVMAGNRRSQGGRNGREEADSRLDKYGRAPERQHGRPQPPPRYAVRDQGPRQLREEGHPYKTERGEHVGLQQQEDELTGEELERPGIGDGWSANHRGFGQQFERESPGYAGSTPGRYVGGAPEGYGGHQYGGQYGGPSPGRGDNPADFRYGSRGPKGYKRSDERIREDVCDRIARTPNLDASDVEVSVTGGEVLLSGTVPQRSMKWELEQIAEGVPGVFDVNVSLRVKRENEPLLFNEPTDLVHKRGQHSHK
jgi:hypothetical protein